jgi:hypothetical protein
VSLISRALTLSAKNKRTAVAGDYLNPAISKIKINASPANSFRGKTPMSAEKPGGAK